MFGKQIFLSYFYLQLWKVKEAKWRALSFSKKSYCQPYIPTKKVMVKSVTIQKMGMRYCRHSLGLVPAVPSQLKLFADTSSLIQHDSVHFFFAHFLQEQGWEFPFCSIKSDYSYVLLCLATRALDRWIPESQNKIATDLQRHLSNLLWIVSIWGKMFLSEQLINNVIFLLWNNSDIWCMKK